MHFGISFLGEAVSERKAATYQGWHYNWAQPSLTGCNGAEEEKRVHIRASLLMQQQNNFR